MDCFVMRQLEKLFSFPVFQRFDDFGDVLGSLPRTYEQRIRRINYHKVTHANGGDEFIRAPQEIALGVDGMAVTRKNIFVRMLCSKFMDCGPGADVAPADVRGHYVNTAGALFARGALKDGVVH